MTATFELKRLLRMFETTGRIIWFRPAYILRVKSIVNIRFWKVYEPRSYTDVVLPILERINNRKTLDRSNRGADSSAGRPIGRRTS